MRRLNKVLDNQLPIVVLDVGGVGADCVTDPVVSVTAACRPRFAARVGSRGARIGSVDDLLQSICNSAAIRDDTQGAVLRACGTVFGLALAQD